MGASASFKQHPKLKDYISWFEIPAYDMPRAATFYNTIYNMQMEVVHNGDFVMAYFPADKGIGGALIQGPGCHPNDTGVLIYLNAGGDMDSILARIEVAGGRIIMPKTLIGEQAGFFALFIDSEGNRLALHEGVVKGAGAKTVTVKKAARTTGGASAKAAAKKTAAKKRS
ncbi:MAG: VOC family protein [Flavobacteriales bacterium]|nr:VOC family protein [Flavobacteriales bacterium]